MANTDFIYQDILNNPKLSKEQKVYLLNKVKEEYDKFFDEQLRKEVNKYRMGAALEIASSVLPMGGAGKLGAKVGADLLKSKLGRKISEEIGSGISSGMASGAVFGAGRGMLENKNPFLTSSQDLLIDGILGGTTGAIGANAVRAHKANQLRNYDLNIKNSRYLRKQAEKYYSNYVQGRIINNKDLGDIQFTRKGMDETFSKNAELVKQFPDLIKNIKNAKYIETSSLYKNRKDDIKNFHVLKNNDKEFLIAENANGQKKFYLTKESIADQGLPPRLGGASISDTNYILPTQTQYFNHPNGYNSKIFTREEIDQMSLEEFSKNEEAIMKQLKDKGIPTNRELEKSSKSKTATKMKSSGKGHWVTINGNHVFIED